MNIFESTFEKHKQLVLEKRKEISPEDEKFFKDTENALKKMSTKELTQAYDNYRKEIDNAKDEEKKAKTGEEKSAAKAKIAKATKAAQMALGIRKSGLSRGAKGSETLSPEETTRIRAKLSDIMDKDYPGFVGDLKQAISDPKVQKFLLSAKGDKTGFDDTVEINARSQIPVNTLKATQNEVFFENSILKPLSFGPKGIKQIENYIVNGYDAGMPKIVVSGEYVIDGHHRWSQIVCWNKNGKADAWDITFGDGGGYETVLKKVQIGIAASVGDVPAGDVKTGKNLFGMGEGEFKSLLVSNFKGNAELLAMFRSPNVRNAMNANIAIKSSGEASDGEKAQAVNEAEDPADPVAFIETVIHPYMWSNAQILDSSKQGPFPRSIMPQTGENEPPEKYVRTLKSGNVNLDVKTEGQLFESTFKKFRDLYTK